MIEFTCNKKITDEEKEIWFQYASHIMFDLIAVWYQKSKMLDDLIFFGLN